MDVVGPTGELKGFTSTGFRVLVHVAGWDGESDTELDGDGCDHPAGEA